MLFNSWIFVLFLAIVLPVYYALAHRWQNRFLVVASYIFYGYWDWRFCSLLIISTVVDYTVAQWISRTESQRRRKRYLLISIAANLGILGFFKYFNFFIGSAVTLLTQFGMEPNLQLLSVVLPVGISFYTFQTMAYTIDVYRRQHEPERDIVVFALYVCYFPQLVAGPIERASRLLPQITSPRRVDRTAWLSASQLILWGYVKKVAVADSLAPYVEEVFSNPSQHAPLVLVFAVYAFALQIYCDFSGYTDIARGVSRLFGIELMVNFRQPYLSRSITKFWRRWHISLSFWLRDYLYIPLGGNRGSRAMQYRNLMLTMLLGGLWHGANWTFVVWGGLHGAYLAAHKWITHNRKIGLEPAPTSIKQWIAYGLGVFATFHVVCLAWVFFRARTLGDALDYLTWMSTVFVYQPGAADRPTLPGFGDALLLYGGVVLLMDFSCWRGDRESPVSDTVPWWARGLAYAAGLLLLSFVREGAGESFIYFQF